MKKINKRIIVVTIIVLLLLTTSFIVYKNYKHKMEVLKEKKSVMEIKSHYNNYVITTKDTKIYNNKNKKYGNISKNFTVELENMKIKNSSQKYFKVKNQDFYLYYKDVIKGNKIEPIKINNNYLVFNKNVKTKDKTNLIKDNKFIKINKSFELPIQYMDNDYYYVYYLDDIFKIKKEQNIELVESNNTDISEVSYISILNLSNINFDKIKEKLDYLKKEEFYTITLDEYKNWLNGNIRLKEKAILLTLDTLNEEKTNLSNDYNFNFEITKDSGLKFLNNNKSTNKESKIDNLNSYIINNDVNMDTFKKMTKGEAIVNKTPVISKPKALPPTNTNASKIAVLNYHFFYDKNLGESCNEGICLEVKKFREQLQYLKDNNYKTLTMDEFKKWMYGEIELPSRSVLLTIDDGAMGTGKHNGNKLIPLLEEYNMNATLFLITGWWDRSNYISDRLDVESHTNDMHTNNFCSNMPRGAQMLCSTKEQVMNDLKKSIEILGSNTAFCFPFYAYNTEAIESVKESGFKLAFIGGNTKASRNNNKYMIPRYPIYNSTTLNQFINMIN